MNPLAIRIAANLAEFKANMAEMRTQLETNASAMKRMSNSFDGSRVIGDANAMVKAIGDIGGASKLTDSEMKRVNSTVTEALAKYKALGREAPAELVALQKATAKVNTETEKMPSLMDRVKSSGVAMGAAIGTFVGNIAWSAVNKLGSELGEFAKRGLQLQAVESSFERLAKGANVSSVQLLDGMKKASRGMVSEIDLMLASNKALLLGLPITAESMNTLTKSAVVLGKAMGKDATSSVDDLITALGRSSPQILDNLGITVKLSEANEAHAAKLKKTVEQLTEAEKKTAFYEETMRKAKEATDALGDSTKTLGERLQTAWVSIGNVVTGVVSEYNIGIGAALANTQSFGRFLSVAMTQGLGAAVSLFAAMERGKGIVEQLTDSQKKYVDELIKAKGIDVVTEFAKGDKAMMAYIQSLKLGKKETSELTAEQKAAIKEAERLAAAFQKQVDVLTGKGLTKEIEELVKQVEAAGKQGGLSAFQYERLSKELGDKFRQGARFANEELFKIWQSHERLNPSIKVTTDAYKILASVMSKPIKLGLPIPTDRFKVSSDPYGIIDQIERSLVLMGKDTRIKLTAAPVVKTWVDGFKSFLGQASSDLGNSILRAIEGGGNVILAGIGSLAQSAGQFFGSKFSTAMKKDLVTGEMVREMSDSMASILSSGVSAIVGVMSSIVSDMLKPSYTIMEQLSRQFGKSVDVVTEQLKAMGAAGVAAFNAINTAEKGIDFSRWKSERAGMKDAQSLFGLLDQFQTKEELAKIAEQWKGVYDYMLSSGKYTAQQLAEAWKQYEDAQKKAIGAIDPVDSRPVGARGFPTKAQLQQAVKEAEEAYLYIRDSGLYTADVIEQAWQQWQDAMISSGDVTAKRMKELTAEITSLQKAVEAETPEYDAEGVRIYGVEELRNIERLAALEAEKAALNLVQIAEEEHATELAAKEADLQAKKEFEAAKIRANELDSYLKKLFTGGYEIPITFKLPNGSPGGQPSSPPSWFGGSSTGATPAPSGGGQAAFTIVNVTELDGEVVAKKTVKHTAKLLPGELSFTGAWQ